MQLSRLALRQITCRRTWRTPSSLVTRTFFYGIPRPSHSSISSSLHVHPIQLLISRLAHRTASFSNSSHPSQSFPDSSRPDLFYHVVQPPTPISKSLPAYALSFSPEKPPSSSSKTIIGWLPAQEDAVGGSSTRGEATLTDFVVNPAFVEVLQSAIKDGLREGVDEIQKATAMQTIQGWMHIQDQRNIPALNRIGDPDDIIGTVLVEDSEILPETYQPMLAYRLVTTDGLMQLTPGLAEKLRATLAKIAEAEKASIS